MKKDKDGDKKEESFRQEVLGIEDALRGSADNYSHHAFLSGEAVITIVKPVEQKKLSVHIYLCEPGDLQYREIDRGEISISKNAKLSTIVKSGEGVVKVDIAAVHGKKKKQYSLKYYQ